MLSQNTNIISVLIVALCVLLVASFVLIAYICTRLLQTVQVVLSRVESSLTTMQQYMYMMRGDINEMNRDITPFLVNELGINMVSERRRNDYLMRPGRGPPSPGEE